jgi:uncharacterized ParB-like nuclease family protein
MLDALTTTIAATDARADFRGARRGHRAAGARGRFGRRRTTPTRPRHLGDAAALVLGRPRLRSIPLDAIVGTVEPTSDFDAEFRPATDRVSSRWENVARAHRDGRVLPPIAVVERPDGHYVLDGCHRVSVARALGRDFIDALVTPAPPPAPRAGRRVAA